MAAFGVRDVCNVVLKSLRNIPACRSIIGRDISRGEPVVYFDSLKISTLSGTGTTVYATGGSGNNRRMAWDGDKEILFHVEDALLTPESFAIMSGAKLRQHEVITKDDMTITTGMLSTDSANTMIDPGFTVSERNRFVEVTSLTKTDRTLVNPLNYTYNRATGIITVNGPYATGTEAIASMTYKIANSKPIIVHKVITKTIDTAETLELDFVPVISSDYPLFIYQVLDDGSRGPKITGLPAPVPSADGSGSTITSPEFVLGKQYLVDTYKETSGAVDRLVLTADATSDYYKLEGETVFYRESDGEPLPAYLTIFKVKPRTTFELAMNPTGDPATFAIDFDSFPQKNVPGFEKCKNGILFVLDIELDTDDEDCDCTWEV